jgi:hypothetical protein
METSMIKLSTITYLVALSVLLNVSAAQAEEKDKPAACRADVEKLCKGIQPGGGRIAMCLKQHESELSPRCREGIAEAKEQIKDFAEACKPDAEKLCKGVQPGQGRIAQCLKQHEAELSAECKAHHPQERGGEKK